MTSRRLPPGRRGRAVLAWAAVVFAATQLAAGLLLDYAWPGVRFPSLDQVVGHWRARRQAPEILCLGSSRFGAGLNPAEMRGAFREALGDAPQVDVFNGSVPGGDPITEDYIFGRLVRAGRRPTMLLLEVSPETVNAYNPWFFAHVTRQLRWEDLFTYLPDVCRAGQFGRLAAARLVPLSVHNAEIRRRAARLWSPPPPRDEGEPIDWNQMLLTPSHPAGEAERSAATRDGLWIIEKKLRHYRIGGTTAAALERLLGRCQRLRITVLLVGVPVGSAQRECYTPETVAAYRAYMARLCDAYSAHFVDWRDRMPDSAFLDNHHLLPAGAEEFGRQLTREVLAPLWRETHPNGSSTACGGACPP